MNWLIVLPLLSLMAALAVLVARGRVGSGGPTRLQPVLGVMTGVVMGTMIVALNHDLVTDEVEIALALVLIFATVIALTMVAFEFVRG